MKKLIILLGMLVITIQLQAKLVLGYAPCSYHLRSLNRECNQNNQILQLGFEKNDYTISVITFKNTYGQRSNSIMLDKKFKKSKFYLKIGAGIVKGYEREGYYTYNTKVINGVTYNYRAKYNNWFVFHKDYGVLVNFGAGYSCNNTDFELNVVGDAITLGIKYKF